MIQALSRDPSAPRSVVHSTGPFRIAAIRSRTCLFAASALTDLCAGSWTRSVAGARVKE